jgi:Ser/Thr protein kinase RdoA (MazF antagonist)
MTASANPPDVHGWSGVEPIRPMGGGARNPVYLARRGRQDFVVRISGRSAQSVEWELDLLDALDAAGVAVPRSVRTDDGRRHHRGVVVQPFIAGGPPRDRHDWARVVTAIDEIHQATIGWPQRPGFASASELMDNSVGGDVDLDAMPADAAELIRNCWRRVVSGPQSAIHGDLGEQNIIMTHGQVALIDWDEARADVPAFDFTDIPADVPVPLNVDRTALFTAGLAWDTAACWTTEPDYAARRLAELRVRP